MRTEAQKRADRKYLERNKEARAKAVAKSGAKKYITKLADLADLIEIQQWIENRMMELKG